MKESLPHPFNRMNQQFSTSPYSTSAVSVSESPSLSSSMPMPNVESALSSISPSMSLSSSMPVMDSMASMADPLDINGYNNLRCDALYSSSQDFNYQQYNPNRHYARNTLLAVGGRAQALINSTSMMRFSLSTVSKLVPGSARNYTLQQWRVYGDPILDRLDATIDEAVNAISIASSGLNTSSSTVAPSYQSLNVGTLPSSFSEYRQSEDPTQLSHEPNSDSSILHKEIDELESKSLSSDEIQLENKQNALVAVSEDSSSSLYALYWERLKQKFVNSHWYSKVDSILLQNYVVRAFTDRMVRPAEVFYNTVTEEFVSHATQEEFLDALKARVGPAWDDRLAPLAKGFYTTAKTVSTIVGAGKFVGGALQLGKARVNRAIEDILQQWDRVLGITDEFVDRLLPGLPEGTERELLRIQDSRRLRSEGEGDDDEELTDGDTDLDDSDDISLASSDESETESIGAQRNIKKRSCEHLSQYDGNTDDEIDECETSDSNLPTVSENFDNTKRVRTSREIVYKFGKRLRQRMPSFPPIPSVRDVSDNVSNYSTDLKQKLIESAWFTKVDDILLQNTFVRAVASFMRPAEHFYNTALTLFNSPKFTEQVALVIPTLTASTSNDFEDETEDVFKHSAGDSFQSNILASSTSSSDSLPPLSEIDESSLVADSASEIASFESSSPLSVHNSPSSELPLPNFPLQTRARSSSPVGNRNNISNNNNNISRAIPKIDIDSPGFQPIVGEFVGTMRSYLGDSWDARLEPMTRSFLQAAITVAPKSSA